MLFSFGVSSLYCGIPEPSLVYYGEVRDPSSGIRLTTGTLEWTFEPEGGGEPILVTTTLTNINDQFSYVLFVPVQSTVPGIVPSTDALLVAASPVTYNRSGVTVGGIDASLVSPASETFALNRTDRGRAQRVDLTVVLDPVDSDGNGLLDDWEVANFGAIGQDPDDDPDGDGMKNFEEQKAGTNPNDESSQFQFIRITPAAQGGALVEWSSVEGRVYTILRSASVLGDYEPIVTGLSATPPSNSHRDAAVTDEGLYFYRILLED